jgi:cob(I)alamin adenosyltransferase
MRIYTRKGDDGTTGLYYGGRVAKDSDRIELTGSIDEAQAALGVARAESERDDELDLLLIGLERDLWVLMAEVATDPSHQDRLVPGSTAVTQEMIDLLEGHIDALSERTTMPKEFVVPGQDRCSAALDLARTIVRRAERIAVRVETSEAVRTYLNRLSDLVWTIARWQEGEHHLRARTAPPKRTTPRQRQGKDEGHA